jgi:hypothetical protein
MPPATPFLLTPGPLTTTDETKRAMLRDWGSRDTDFIALNRKMRDRLVALTNGTGTHVAVPLQGSGTFVVEAMLGTFVPRTAKLLILVNGAYGRRMAQMCKYYGRAYVTYETAEDVPPDPAEVDARLARDGDSARCLSMPGRSASMRWRPPPTNASKACRGWASSSPARPLSKNARAMLNPSASTSTTSGAPWRGTASGASRRPPM